MQKRQGVAEKRKYGVSVINVLFSKSLFSVKPCDENPN